MSLRSLGPALAVVATLLLGAAIAGSSQSSFRVNEFIYETAPYPACHASTIVETNNGLVAAWFGGTAERNPDVGIWVSRLEGGRWTTPVEVANGVESATTRYPTWNPVLFQPRNGPLQLYYKVGPSPSAWWGVVKTSIDGGRTWSAATRLPGNLIGPVKNKPVQLANGRVVAGSSTENDGWRLHMESSTDDGATWTATPALNDGKQVSAIQPSILVHPDGHLQAVGRTRNGKLFSTTSRDRGTTWSPLTLLDLPNPSAGTDAVTLQDGRFLLVYNHTATGRSPLNVAVSSDGRAWQAAAVLENEPGAEFSYPAVIQTRDGLVHITYTWKRQRIKHVVLDLARLSLAPITGGAWP